MGINLCLQIKDLVGKWASIIEGNDLIIAHLPKRLTKSPKENFTTLARESFWTTIMVASQLNPHAREIEPSGPVVFRFSEFVSRPSVLLFAFSWINSCQ